MEFVRIRSPRSLAGSSALLLVCLLQTSCAIQVDSKGYWVATANSGCTRLTVDWPDTASAIEALAKSASPTGESSAEANGDMVLVITGCANSRLIDRPTGRFAYAEFAYHTDADASPWHISGVSRDGWTSSVLIVGQPGSILDYMAETGFVTQEGSVELGASIRSGKVHVSAKVELPKGTIDIQGIFDESSSEYSQGTAVVSNSGTSFAALSGAQEMRRRASANLEIACDFGGTSAGMQEYCSGLAGHFDSQITWRLYAWKSMQDAGK